MEWGEEALEKDTVGHRYYEWQNWKKWNREFYLKREGDGNIWGRRIKIIEKTMRNILCLFKINI